MAAPDLRGLIQTGYDILTTAVDKATKKITAQIGSVVGQTTDSDGAEWWQHYGLASRPPKPEAGKTAAQAVVIKGGDRDICIASQDLRGLELYGSLDHGEVCLYSAGDTGTGQARILLKKDGSVSLFTKQGNASGGTGMLIQLDAAGNAIRLLNASGHGIIIDDEGVKVTSGGAALTLKAGGDASLIGKGSTQVDGSGVVIGSLAVPGVNSALTGVTGVAGKASLKVLIE